MDQKTAHLVAGTCSPQKGLIGTPDLPQGKSFECFREVDVEEIDEDQGWKGLPFDPNLIDINVQSQAISNIVAQMEAGEIDLMPDFQRSENIWSPGKQSRLIESILLRIPLPAFYFDVEVKGDQLGIRRNYWHVIDGLQRLCSIRNFVAHIPGQEHLTLEGLEFLSSLDGKTFDDLPGPYQRIIRETSLTVYLVRPGTPDNVKFNIFKRVNTGGVPLTQQEIRHALNQGVAAKFLEELASSSHFVEATEHHVKPLRMLDREFVNRFLAFFLLKRAEDEDMDAYYNRALSVIRGMSQDQLNEVKDSFYSSLDILHSLFGKWAFCKLDKYPKTKPINKVLFEVMSVSVARLSRSERAILMRVDREKALARYVQMFSDASEFTGLVSVSTGDPVRTEKRYEVADSFLHSLIEGCHA